MTNMMVISFQKAHWSSAMSGEFVASHGHFSEVHPVFVYRSILHDPEVYPSPYEFKPERFLKDGQLNLNVQDPSIASFGFGRRQVNTSTHHNTTDIFLQNLPREISRRCIIVRDDIACPYCLQYQPSYGWPRKCHSPWAWSYIWAIIVSTTIYQLYISARWLWQSLFVAGTLYLSNVWSNHALALQRLLSVSKILNESSK